MNEIFWFEEWIFGEHRNCVLFWPKQRREKWQVLFWFEEKRREEKRNEEKKRLEKSRENGRLNEC